MTTDFYLYIRFAYSFFFIVFLLYFFLFFFFGVRKRLTTEVAVCYGYTPTPNHSLFPIILSYLWHRHIKVLQFLKIGILSITTQSNIYIYIKKGKKKYNFPRKRKFSRTKLTVSKKEIKMKKKRKKRNIYLLQLLSLLFFLYFILFFYSCCQLPFLYRLILKRGESL